MEPRKKAILDALSAFMNQRPGLEPGNYIDRHWPDPAGRKAYFAESRAITKDLRQARTLLMAVARTDDISADDLLAAAPRALGGRLTITDESCFDVYEWIYKARVDYCTGQYFPTEYRRAVCAVLASALWEYTREECMPPPLTTGEHTTYLWHPAGQKSPDAKRAGEWLRAYFRQQFGKGIASRWFS